MKVKSTYPSLFNEILYFRMFDHINAIISDLIGEHCILVVFNFHGICRSISVTILQLPLMSTKQKCGYACVCVCVRGGTWSLRSKEMNQSILIKMCSSAFVQLFVLSSCVCVCVWMHWVCSSSSLPTCTSNLWIQLQLIFHVSQFKSYDSHSSVMALPYAHTATPPYRHPHRRIQRIYLCLRSFIVLAKCGVPRNKYL